MSGKPLRLLHAANLQLDCPLRFGHTDGLYRSPPAVNEEVRDIIDSATVTAFDRIVTTSIEKDVDALLITGNTFDASSPGRGGSARWAE